MTVVSPVGARRPAIDRSGDRLVTLAGIVIAVSYLGVALVALALPEQVRRGLWLPLHLALAGGATNAIVAVMPFFVAAFAAAPPADGRVRAASLAATAVGAAGVTIGVVGSAQVVATAGGVSFVAGLVLAAVAMLTVVRHALGPARGIVVAGYAAALASVVTGASLATLDVAGTTSVVLAWPHLRPAHAWLNLVGFVSLVTATTLLHFFPTVVGARIANHPSARLTVAGLAVGSAVVAVGYALDIDPAVRAGAVVAIAGAGGLAWYATRIWRTRARWTTDHAWHRFAIGGLVSAVAWFIVGLAAAAGRAAVLGSSSASWETAIVIGPLVAGWVGLAILASASHLLAAVGPGDLAAHARQRRILGRGAAARLVALDVGVALASLGMVLGDGWGGLTAAGLVLLATGFVATAALIAAAVAVPLGARRRASP